MTPPCRHAARRWVWLRSAPPLRMGRATGHSEQPQRGEVDQGTPWPTPTSEAIFGLETKRPMTQTEKIKTARTSETITPCQIEKETRVLFAIGPEWHSWTRASAEPKWYAKRCRMVRKRSANCSAMPKHVFMFGSTSWPDAARRVSPLLAAVAMIGLYGITRKRVFKYDFAIIHSTGVSKAQREVERLRAARPRNIRELQMRK